MTPFRRAIRLILLLLGIVAGMVTVVVPTLVTVVVVTLASMGIV